MLHDEPVFYDALFRSKRKKGAFRIVEPPTPPLEGLVADTHAHLEMLADIPLALARCAFFGLDFVCCITDVSEDELAVFSQAALWREEAAAMLSQIAGGGESATGTGAHKGEGALPRAAAETAMDGLPHASSIPHIRAAIGCHPHNAKSYSETLESSLLERLADPLACAIGEVGLDYHYDFSPRDVQRNVFRAQIALAHMTGLPLVLHIREAHDDALAIMEEEGFPEGGTLLHCFNLDAQALAPWVAHGCFIALGGPLTFKGSDELRSAALQIPLDRILTETDAPFMTPEPMRGMDCEPSHTIFTAQRLAQVLGFEPGERRKRFLEGMYQNALGLLDRQPTAWQQQAQGSWLQVPLC